MITYQDIKKLCKKKGVTITGTEKELGFSKGSLCKIETSKPSAEKVKKLADYFDIPVSVFYDESDEQKYYLNEETAAIAQEMFEKDKILFDVYRSTDKERLIEYAKKLKALRDMEEGGV